MLTLLLYTLATFGALSLLLTVWFVCLFCWIARGEPDVNGDPERDGGAE